ncbi:LLM class flavin-dependent oxidoreductase [Pseudonocardia xinjiangensis]|uniref:LLM class flavin-dependent oxidoreductase n=1 Tax=Pseudonocardia xinjiangensis TaxID=75289 RepID=A0ABX1R5X9_9PSEU|nr:LLM class flavin-dependent oxidoreductase [Pseudonocardia xinjiangensis]NMH75796.1 LLM class flavin-dependent oxidoreductase [Pseudonocardia xinjiangensis]
MRFGYAICSQNYWDWKRFTSGVDQAVDYPDHQLTSEAVKLAVLADDLGFDTLWSTEHHFSPYLMTPSPIQMLSYLAGRTRNADVGSAVIVLPWHDPVRLAEEIAMMDIMLGDRMLFLGFGRGASADEFDGLRIPMSQSRARFAECLEIIRRGLSETRFSFEGEYYQIPEIEIRPKSRRDVAGRMYCAWMSPETLEIAAKQRLGPLFAVSRDLEDYPKETASFNEARAGVGLGPSAPIVINAVACAESEQEAYERALHYQEYQESVALHYNWIDAERYKKIGGYDYYIAKGQELGAEQVRHDKVAKILWGTPDQLIEKIKALQEAASAGEIAAFFRYGGMSFETAERNMRLFAEKVLPAVHGFSCPVPG